MSDTKITDLSELVEAPAGSDLLTIVDISDTVMSPNGTNKKLSITSLFTNSGFTTAANPISSDGAALGTTSLMWSDLFLASGAVINFNDGDITLTHSENKLAFEGGSLEFSDGDLHITTDTVDAQGTYQLRFQKKRLSSPYTVRNNDLLGQILFRGYDGDGYITGALISAEIDGTPGDGDMPTRLAFLTTADGSNIPIERMRIDSAGNVGIGTTSPGYKFTVQSEASETTLGSNLLTNGDFADGFTGWNAGANWAAGTGAAVHTAGAVEAISQDITVTTGQYYQIDFTETGDTAGSLTFAIGSESVTRAYWQATSVTIKTSGATGTQTFSITPISDYNGTLDNITIRLVTPASTPALTLLNTDGTAGGVQIKAGGSGLNNIFIGSGSGRQNTTGYYNNALGYYSLYSNTTGYYNNALGVNSLYSNTTGYYNNALGVNSLYSNTTGYYNNALGYNSLYSNTTGYSNNALGYQSLYSNTTGDSNNALGVNSLYSNTTGYYNNALGYNSLYSNTTGNYNNALGYQSLYSNTTGAYNNALGYRSLYSNKEGSNNVAIGNYAGYSALGSNNVFIGNEAGKYETGSNAFYVDNQNRTNTAGDKAGALLYGTFNATPASQTLKINAAITMPVVYSTTVGGTNRDLHIDDTGLIGYVSSSIRYKDNVENLINTDRIYDLRPVSFTWKKDGIKSWGLIAEEADKVMPEIVSYNAEGVVESVEYTRLIAPMLAEIQNLKKEIEELKK